MNTEKETKTISKRGRFSIVSYSRNNKNITPKKRNSRKGSKSKKRTKINIFPKTLINKPNSNPKYNYVNKINANNNFVLTKLNINLIDIIMMCVKNNIKTNNKNIRKINEELLIILQNDIFDPFNKSTEMTPFTRWKTGNSKINNKKIYTFSQNKFVYLMSDIVKNINKLVKNILLKLDKLKSNTFINKTRKSVTTLLDKLNAGKTISTTQRNKFSKDIKILDTLANDKGRLNN